MNRPHPGAIMFIGPPGSGKGTQANAIVDARSEYYHFDTGRELELILNDPKWRDDPEMEMRREKFRKGYLSDSDWTVSVIKEGLAKIAASGRGIIFSGSPRTREEANFLLPELIDTYGLESIVVIHLSVKLESSVFRNSRRKICSRCGRPLMWSPENEKLAFCPLCGGELVSRSLDNAESMKLRLEEYRHRTEEVLNFCTALGVRIFNIDGDRLPEEVTRNILAILDTQFA